MSFYVIFTSILGWKPIFFEDQLVGGFNPIETYARPFGSFPQV